MSNNIKDINIKNWTYCLFNDIIHIEKFDPNNMEIDKKSYKNILYYILYYLLNLKYWIYDNQKIRKNL